MSTEQDNLDEWAKIRIPFAEQLGFQLTRMWAGKSEIEYAAKPEHFNKFGIPHGGVLMTLLDISMAAAASSVAPGMGAITIEMKTSFMRPAKGILKSRGEVLHHTRKTAFMQANVFDAEGILCAQATGTFKFVPNPSPVD